MSIPPIETDLYPAIIQDYIPPYCAPHALQAVSVARSYLNARMSGRQFFYSHQTCLTEGYGIINDANGKALIDCSTFMHLVLMGIRYKDSPFLL